MSAPPDYHSPPNASRRPMPSVPPGAGEAGPPGAAPPVPTRVPSMYTEQRYGSYNKPALPAPPSSQAMGEFGAGYAQAGGNPSTAGSASGRPLPTQPPVGLPSNPYPTSTSSGSIGGRRTLPTPPAMSASQSAPLPPPRPVGRQLPTLPPAPQQARISSGSYANGDFAPSPVSHARIHLQANMPASVIPAVSRQASQRYNEHILSDSPTALSNTPSSSDYGYSNGPSRNTSTYDSSTSSHVRDAYSTETGATSVPSRESIYDAYIDPDKLDEVEDTGTNITLRPPSRGPARSTSPAGQDWNDGRRTPTASNWTLELEPPNLAHLGIGVRQRTTSSSTIGAVDAGLPVTPTFAPQPILQHQRSFVDGSSNASFAVPQLSLPGASTSSSLATSQSGRSTPYNGEAAPVVSTRGTPVPFPEARERAPRRRNSRTSSMHPSITSSERPLSSVLSPSWNDQPNPPSSWVQTKLQIHRSQLEDQYFDDEGSVRRPSAYEEDILDEYEDEDEEEAEVNEIKFFQPAFLSEGALQLRYRVERSRQMKAGIAWVGSFTGRDIVNTIQSFLPDYTRDSPNDRRAALVVARSLQAQLWFVEVDWDIKPLRDSSEDVYRFMSEMEGMGEGLTSELPAGLMTMATKCYSPSCTGDDRCYAPRCPFKVSPDTFLGLKQPAVPTPAPSTSMRRGDWTQDVDPFILHGLSEKQYTRQTIIRNAIESEVQYEADLTTLEKLFIQGLREADPPVIAPARRLEQFIHDVFCNERELHETCRRLIDHFAIRERESPQSPLILSVGDIFLTAAADFRMGYPEYTGNLPAAEAIIKKEMDENPEFRFFCERVVRETDRRRDIKYLVTRPSTQLQRYPAVIEAILNSTEEDDPDRDFLVEALATIQNLTAMSQLKHFHASKGRGPAGKLEWQDLVPEEQRKSIDKKEQKRQMRGEMEYVADLETIDALFVDGLRIAERGIVIERTRLEIFLDDAFHNYRSLLEVHQNLLENMQNRQIEQHPRFGMVSDLLLDAALNWQDAYMEYVTHYPIAKAKVHEEETRNPKFAAFLKECLRDPASNRQDIYHFINRPIPRLLRYNLLLQDILKSLKESGVADNHPDIENIPQVMEIIDLLAKATQKGVAVNEAKVQLWQYQHSLDGGRFGPRTVKDLDLLNPMRELINRGKVFRQPEGTIGSSWAELTVLLFDNYFVLVKTEKQSRSKREGEKIVRYFINRRPIPLELLNLGSFADAPRARTKTKLLGVGGSSHEPEGTGDAQDSKNVWPFTISFIGQGQLGGQYTLWCDSYASRAEWQEKLQHAKVLRAEVNDANKVFEMTPLSMDTFYMAPNYAAPPKDGDSPWTGRVTCSVPFETVDRRSLVAVGCDEGVWIGLRHDARSLRKVLHVKAVTNIAVLEEFGIFLVLQDKSLLAYHLEALVPSAASPQVRAAPQRLSPGKDIVFFTVGQLSGRTLVLYMKRKGMDSLFRVLEPILGRNTEDQNRQRRPFGNLLGQRTEWFRLYKDFFIPTEALGVHFLKHKLAVVCSKGFEIMDLTDLKGGSIPIFDPAKVRDKPKLAEIQRRCEASKPLGMFRSTETEFLLCYDSFGVYVDRHGEPNRDCQVIEWEGRPDSVAFHPPYLLLCSAPFIEVRHIDNAKLLQIYTGTDIRLTWDGTGGQAHPPVDNPGPKGYGDETSSQEPRLHICQRPEGTGRTRHGIGQHVFELTPTLALNNPLLNPVHTHDANYFPPAPMVGTVNRASSVLTTSTSDGYYVPNITQAQLQMSAMNGRAEPNGGPPANQVYGNYGGFPTPGSRSSISWESNGHGQGQAPGQVQNYVQAQSQWQEQGYGQGQGQGQGRGQWQEPEQGYAPVQGQSQRQEPSRPPWQTPAQGGQGQYQDRRW